MFRAIACTIALTCVCACGQTAQPHPDPDAAAQLGEPEALPRTLPPRRADTPRFVGRWATAEAECVRNEWVFDASTLSAPDGLSCSFDTVAMTQSGYMIEATCSGDEGARRRIQIAFAESAQSMLLTGAPAADEETGLIYCRAP